MAKYIDLLKFYINPRWSNNVKLIFEKLDTNQDHRLSKAELQKLDSDGNGLFETDDITTFLEKHALRGKKSIIKSIFFNMRSAFFEHKAIADSVFTNDHFKRKDDIDIDNFIARIADRKMKRVIRALLEGLDQNHNNKISSDELSMIDANSNKVFDKKESNLRYVLEFPTPTYRFFRQALYLYPEVAAKAFPEDNFRIEGSFKAPTNKPDKTKIAKFLETSFDDAISKQTEYGYFTAEDKMKLYTEAALIDSNLASIIRHLIHYIESDQKEGVKSTIAYLNDHYLIPNDLYIAMDRSHVNGRYVYLSMPSNVIKSEMVKGPNDTEIQVLYLLNINAESEQRWQIDFDPMAGLGGITETSPYIYVSKRILSRGPKINVGIVRDETAEILQLIMSDNPLGKLIVTSDLSTNPLEIKKAIAEAIKMHELQHTFDLIEQDWSDEVSASLAEFLADGWEYSFISWFSNWTITREGKLYLSFNSTITLSYHKQAYLVALALLASKLSHPTNRGKKIIDRPEHFLQDDKKFALSDILLPRLHQIYRALRALSKKEQTTLVNEAIKKYRELSRQERDALFKALYH